MTMRLLKLGLLGCLIVGCPIGNALAQAPKELPKGKPTPVRPEITKEQRLEAVQLLRRHAEASKPVKVLVADYVQTRSTALSKKPLRSSGAFLFVRSPACVVFRAEKPRTSIVRLTKDLYEVYRPRRKRLERFTLQGPDLSQGLFAAVGGDADRLLKDFDVVGLLPSKASGPVGDVQSVAITLMPKSKQVRERLRELVITLAVKAKAKSPVELLAVAYRDHSGDLVKIALQNARSNPKDAPSVAFDVPKDTKIITHRAGR